MAAPANGTTLEGAIGGLPVVRTFGLNTNQASNLGGFLVDSSGNLTAPGTLALTGALTATGGIASGAAITAPVITGGLTASGSASNDFSGSTGSFKFPTGVSIGQKLNVLASSGNTTITTATSGSVRLFDSASTTAYVLPAPSVGLYYDFYWTALETGGQAHSITTDAGTTFLYGYINMISDVNVTPSSTLGPKGFAGAAADNFIKITMNGTTTGGGIGTWLRFICVSSTSWQVSGIVRSPSGTIATPFST